MEKICRLRLSKICKFFILLAAVIFIFTIEKSAYAQDATFTSSSAVCSSVPECSDQNLDCSQCVQFLDRKKNEATSKVKTLSSEIAVVDNQAKLTNSRISAIKEQIDELEKDIEVANKKIILLQKALDESTKALIERNIAAYKVGTIAPWQLLLNSNNIENVFDRLKYIRIVQHHDRSMVYMAEQARVDYVNQKHIFEEKELRSQALGKALEVYTKELEQQKIDKEQLLSITRNDENRYQRLLSEAKAERAVVSGEGDEIFLRTVSAGDLIGTIISGSSGCSSGTHLHFSTYQGKSVKDPSDFLSPKSVTYSYAESEYGYYGTINPHGSYSWPVDEGIVINQAYGSHGFAQQFYASGLHDGIDMVGGSHNVKAVNDGKLYEGSYKCSNGILSYAKVVHNDGLVTWYLHIFAN